MSMNVTHGANPNPDNGDNSVHKYATGDKNMGRRIITGLSAIVLLGFASTAIAEMEVSKWYAGCESTMTTNHFDLAPGEVTEPIYLDYSNCSDAEKGTLLVYGYSTTKTSSRQLQPRHNIRLTAVPADESVGTESVSDDGSLAIDIPNAEQGCWVYAENMNKRKSIKLRLRAQLLGE